MHGIIWFLGVINTASFSPFSESHDYCLTGREWNLLVVDCNAVVATHRILLVMYIAKSSANSDPSTTFPNSPKMPYIVTRKRVTLNTPPCGIPKSVCLFCDVVPLTLTHSNQSLFHWIHMFSNCWKVLSLFTLSYAFSMSKKIAPVFLSF